MTVPADLAAGYADALRGYLLVGGEVRLTAAYELGRRAVAAGVTVLELSDLHHDALLGAMGGAGDGRDAVAAGRDVLREALSAYEMVRRGFPPRHLCRATAATVEIGEGPGAATAVEHDPDAAGWAAFLRAPALRERASAEDGLVRLDGAGLAADPVLQRLATSSGAARTMTGWMVAPVRATDGRRLGTIALFATGGGAFSEVDADVARHLALLASDALERRARPRDDP